MYRSAILTTAVLLITEHLHKIIAITPISYICSTHNSQLQVLLATISYTPTLTIILHYPEVSAIYYVQSGARNTPLKSAVLFLPLLLTPMVTHTPPS